MIRYLIKKSFCKKLASCETKQPVGSLTGELSLNNFHISGRYPLPEKAKPFVLLRAAGSGQRAAGSAPENVEVISGQFRGSQTLIFVAPDPSSRQVSAYSYH